MTPEIEYWDKTWTKRIDKEKMTCMTNIGKFNKIVNELWNMPQLIPLQKLEIGCGPANHIATLQHLCAEWGRYYLGIDLSEVAIDYAKSQKVNAQCMDFRDYHNPPGRAVECFFLLDVLEHIEDLSVLAEKIREVGSPHGYWIIGNIPLYNGKEQSHEDIVEYPMNVDILKDFMTSVGVKEFHHEVYGIQGWPYLVFKTFKKGDTE